MHAQTRWFTKRMCIGKVNPLADRVESVEGFRGMATYNPDRVSFMPWIAWREMSHSQSPSYPSGDRVTDHRFHFQFNPRVGKFHITFNHRLIYLFHKTNREQTWGAFRCMLFGSRCCSADVPNPVVYM